MHSCGFGREGFKHIRGAAQLHTNGLSAAQGSLIPLFPLALVSEVVAVTTREDAAPVEYGDPPATTLSGTQEPRSESPVMTGSANKAYWVVFLLPLV